MAAVQTNTGHARTLEGRLAELARSWPVIVLTGPRQSGKTTLCRMAFADLPYRNLERPETRRLALEDPRAFLAELPAGAVLDEIQRAPELTSYLQAIVDESLHRGSAASGRWILTGSEHLTLTERTSQSLAGRAAYLHLFPFDLAERQAVGVIEAREPRAPWADAALAGGYPAHLFGPRERADWLGNYVQAYVERDVRSLLNIGDLLRFQDFLGLCAGRVARSVNLSRLGADAGVTQPTAKSWLSVLEASFITFRLPPWHHNLGKRITKAPKLGFWDSGLLCWLLGIYTTEQLALHPLRGLIFETWATSDLLKQAHHRGERVAAFYFGSPGGLEVDLLLRLPAAWLAVEFKSATTVAAGFTAGLRRFKERAEGLSRDGLPVRTAVVYGGEQEGRRGDTRIVPWRCIGGLLDVGG